MNLDDLMGKILQILPLAEFGQDNDGQIVIYTNLEMVNADGLLVEMRDFSV